MTQPVLETLCFRITTRCNLHCDFCRANSSPYASEYIDIDLLKRYLLDAQSRLGLKHVSISGGEPTVNRRLTSLITWLTSNGLKVTVTTNGTAGLIDRLKKSGVTSSHLRVRVSIDGDELLHDRLRGKGTYSAALREAEDAKQTLGWVGVNTIVGPMFYKRDLDKTDVFGNLAVDEWALITPVPRGAATGKSWSETIIIPRIVELRKRTEETGFPGRVVIWNFLGTPNTSVLIQADGTIVLCGIRGDDDIEIGSLSCYSIEHMSCIIKTVNRVKDTTHFTLTHKPS